MAKYRNQLPQLSRDLFLTDGGLETALVFHEGIDLPHCAAFVLLETEEGCELLQKYYRRFVAIARNYGLGFILESATWRANPDWGGKLGHSNERLTVVNHKAIELLQEMRSEFENERTKIVISGCLGPRGDAYNPADMMTEQQAEKYHLTQIKTFVDTDADLVSAFTIPYVEEAIGITRAAESVDIPVVISFTVETDGRLPSGEILEDAIKKVDEATENAPAYYMINCSHPTHFLEALATDEPWKERIRPSESRW